MEPTTNTTNERADARRACRACKGTGIRKWTENERCYWCLGTSRQLDRGHRHLLSQVAWIAQKLAHEPGERGGRLAAALTEALDAHLDRLAAGTG